MKTTTASVMGATALNVVPNSVLGATHGHTSPSDKLNIAGVGVGGKGAYVLRQMSSQNIVALCDTDWKYAANTAKEYPKAKRFQDFREMYDKIGNEFDAVVVATADHTHAIIAANAMEMGKHVYCEKPLTHSVYESRLLTKLAAKNDVVTQMGNQGASTNSLRAVCETIWSGAIGEVTKVEAFTDRPIWPQGLMRPNQKERPHKELNWDLFIGPAQYRDYNSIYSPWNWRGRWDFGTGALGDMACHILHPAHMALKLQYPISAQGSSTALLTDSCPNAQMVNMRFPARPNLPHLALPPVEVIWYDGGLKPDLPKGWPAGRDFNIGGGALIFHGTKDTLVCGVMASNDTVYLMSGNSLVTPKELREVKGGHEMDFVNQCTAPVALRQKCYSDFSTAGPFNEMVVMGVLAVRLQELNRELLWDGQNMRFTNITPDETIRIMIEDGFSIKDGHPTFNKTYTDPINALAFSQELIKHTYRDGWALPSMPK